ncbi:hypothetical protein AB3X96_34765 [Paraburkholderia sp. BR13439]|uniref:hypothetical protein n=1 Tax=unclassified Paraburkholderia TaxID=2615204 RepID=UPI0034CF4641
MLSSEGVTLIATRCHLALHAMNTSRGTASTSMTLLEVTLATRLLADMGYGAICDSAICEAARAIKRAVSSGLANGPWGFTNEDSSAISYILEIFERQLKEAPAPDIESAFKETTSLI